MSEKSDNRYLIIQRCVYISGDRERNLREPCFTFHPSVSIVQACSNTRKYKKYKRLRAKSKAQRCQTEYLQRHTNAIKPSVYIYLPHCWSSVSADLETQGLQDSIADDLVCDFTSVFECNGSNDCVHSMGVYRVNSRFSQVVLLDRLVSGSFFAAYIPAHTILGTHLITSFTP